MLVVMTVMHNSHLKEGGSGVFLLKCKEGLRLF